VVAGLALWTHLLAVVYIVPSVIYLALRRRSWAALDLLATAGGFVVGAAPLLAANLTGGFETLGVVGGPSGVQVEPAGELLRFLRTGISMLAGVGLPVPPPTLTQDMAWDVPTAGPWPIVALLVVVLLAVVWLYAGSVRELVSRAQPGPRSDASLLVMLALMVPITLVFTSYGYFMAEPRYALPLYSAVPLAAAAVWRLPGALRWSTCGAVVALNVWNIFATAALIVRPAGLLDTTPANRAVLINYLEQQDRHQVYTDYWIAQTIMFESSDQVQAAVITDGPNRYLPAADNVAQTPNAVTVFVRDSDADQRFAARLHEVGATANVANVDVYHVYSEVTRLQAVLDGFD
jgi:hypothetical protein